MQQRCPVCRTKLTPREVNGLAVLRCATCDGMAINVAVVRACLQVETFKSFWGRVARGEGGSGQLCPSCERPMREVTADGTVGHVPLDVCTRCQLIWFDPAELDALPAKPRARAIPIEARQRIAMEQVRMMGEEARLQATVERARRHAIGAGGRRGVLDVLLDLLGG